MTDTVSTTPATPPGHTRGRERTLDVVGLLARIVLGVVLIWAGAAKVGRPKTSMRAVQAFDILPTQLAGWVGLTLPFVEVILGVLLVIGLFTRVTAVVSTLLMLAFVVGIAQAWARGLTIDCGCFGGGGQVAASETTYGLDIARDLALAACGAYLVWRPRSLFSLDRFLVTR